MPETRVDAVARLLVIGEYDGEDLWDALVVGGDDATFEYVEGLDHDLGDDPARWAEREAARWRQNAQVLIEAADAADRANGMVREEKAEIDRMVREIRELESELRREHARAEGYY